MDLTNVVFNIPAEKFNGLVHSADDEGTYCESCVLFSDRHINALGVFIEQSLTNWKKVI